MKPTMAISGDGAQAYSKLRLKETGGLDLAHPGLAHIA